ncbi:class I SAM-dependent methyltransferase [Melioribacter sp. OK-6-Me]|uniref:class I SAM-dependent methyltransferase n=1 Tax=unclassified Melioribacter TaxID=2627329 RepID=UPI003EDAD3C6
MSDYKFKEVDFDNPSIPFIIEDFLKNLIGEKIFYKSLLSLVNIKGNENILDFGCGGGIGSRAIAKLLTKDGHLTGIDTSTYWTKKAKKRLRKFPNVDILCGDIRNIDIPNQSFDIIYIFHVIHDIRPDERQDTINALKDKLKNSGRIILVEPLKYSHGISPDELEMLMLYAGLIKSHFSITHNEYKGEFRLIK